MEKYVKEFVLWGHAHRVCFNSIQLVGQMFILSMVTDITGLFARYFNEWLASKSNGIYTYRVQLHFKCICYVGILDMP